MIKIVTAIYSKQFLYRIISFTLYLISSYELLNKNFTSIVKLCSSI